MKLLKWKKMGTIKNCIFLGCIVANGLNCMRIHEGKPQIDFTYLRKKVSGNYNTNPSDVLTIYQMTKDVHEVLNKYMLTYWIHAGTLLGAERHRGLIPWDDDIDICIDKKDSDAFFALRSVFNQLNYELIPFVFGYKIFPRNGKPTGYAYKYPWIDIMIWVEINGKYRYDPARKPGAWYDTIFMYRKDLFPLKHYSFGEFSLWGPNNPYPYLDYVYSDWNTSAKVYNHAINLPQKILLTENDRKPGIPTGPMQNKIIP